MSTNGTSTIHHGHSGTVSRIGEVPVSVAIGILLLVGIVFFNEANFRIRTVDQTSLDWQLAAQLMICAGCGLFGLFHLPRTLPLLCRFPGVLSILFGLWALVTVPFAVDVKYSAAACASLWCILLFAPAVLLRLGGRRTVLTILAAFFAFLVGCWLAFYLFPALGRDQFVDSELDVSPYLGGLHHPNGTGRQAAIALVLAMVLGTSGSVRWRLLLLPGLFAAVTLVRTHSRTALLAGLAGLAAVAFWKSNALVRTLLVLGVLLVAVIWTAGDFDADRLAARLSRTGSADEIYSLTGRTTLWRFAIERVRQSPIVGYGYGCPRFITARNAWPTQHAHNSLLNVAIGTGLVGGALVLAMYLWQLLGLVKQPDPFPDIVLVMALVLGTADTVLFHPIPASHTMLWLIALYWRRAGASLDHSTGAAGPREN